MRQEAERSAAEMLRALGLEAGPGQAGAVFAASDGFEMTFDDQAEWQRPLQRTGYFLIASDGVIRWVRLGITPLPEVSELLALV